MSNNDSADKHTAAYLNNHWKGYSNSLGTITSSNVNEWIAEHIVGDKFYGVTLGDKVLISDGTYNKEWVVVGFDADAGDGYNPVLSSPTIMLFPSENLLNSVMNDSNTTVGGYKGSKMYTTTLPTVKSKLQGVLGSHLKQKGILITNTMTATAYGASGLAGASTSWEWVATYLHLLSEVELYGSVVFGDGFDVGTECQQLPLFRHMKYTQAPFSREDFWLRGVASSAAFCVAGNRGYAAFTGASTSYGVRPLIYVG